MQGEQSIPGKYSKVYIIVEPWLNFELRAWGIPEQTMADKYEYI